MLYQRTQATASRSTSPIAPGAGVAGARLVVDEFCFVQGVQRFGQGVVVGTGRTHRRYCLATGESLPVAHVAVLHAPIGVVHKPLSVYVFAASLADRHVQRVQGRVSEALCMRFNRGCQSVCVRGLIYKYAVNLSG